MLEKMYFYNMCKICVNKLKKSVMDKWFNFNFSYQYEL